MWILNQTKRFNDSTSKLYGIKYAYDSSGNDKIEYYGKNANDNATAWIQLNTGDASFYDIYGNSAEIKNNITVTSKGRGLYLTDGASKQYAGIYDNASNLWIGATSSTGQHHKGSTFISAGHNGTTGNKSIYISIPADGNASTTHTSYALVYKDATGNSTTPIYVDADGKTVACNDYTTLFTKLSWTAGNTAGPTLDVTIGGTNKTATIPSASATASGIVTTGAQTFNNIKTFYRESTTEQNYAAGIAFSNKDTTTGQTQDTTYIRAYNTHAANNDGMNMVIRSCGNMFIGGGESPGSLYATLTTSTTEHLFCTADNTIYIEANANTIANRIGIAINTSGAIVPVKAEAANNNKQNIGASDNKFANIYATTFIGALNGNADSATQVKVTGVSLPSSGNVIYYLTYAGSTTTGNQDIKDCARLYLFENTTASYLNIGSSSTSGGITVHNANGKYSDIVSSAFSANRAVTLPDQTGTIALLTKTDINALINLLDTGTSVLTADDYIITQYVGGGTTTTTYHRRAAKNVRVGGLTTARNINGTAFDGTANITTANWGTTRSLTIGNKAQNVNGSAAVTWSLNDILYNATQIGTATSWDQVGPSVYYVASSSAFTGTNHPGNNSEQMPYAYGQLIVSRAGSGGVLQVYAPHTGSAGNTNSGLRYRTGWNSAGWQAWSTILDDRLWRKYIFANKNIGRTTLTVADSTWAVTSGTDVFGLAFKDTGLTYTPSGGSATASSDTGNWRAWLTCDAAANNVKLNMRIDGSFQSDVLYSSYIDAYGAAQPTAGKLAGLTGAHSRLYGNALYITNPTTTNDQGWIRVLGTGESDTVLEIATGDDGGAGEQIVCRQYNTSNAVARELKLLDTSGNTTLPGNLYIAKTKTIGAADSASRPYQIYLGRNTTVGSNAINSTNPLIEFSNSDRSQYAQLVYTDYDAVAAPDSLTLVGNQAGTHFIAPKINTSDYINNSYAMSTSSFICNSWVRTKGSTGWYNEDYGGGWYMSDNVWIRSYNNKSVYVNTGDLRCDGSTWGAKLRMTDNWLGFYAGKGDATTRYGYIQCNADRMYFRKENSTANLTYYFDFGNTVQAPTFRAGNDNATYSSDRCKVYAANGTIGIHSSTNRGLYEFTDSKWIIYLQHSDDTVRSSYKIYGAVWNDFAEMREGDITEGGYAVYDDGHGHMKLCTERLQPGARLTSDTFGIVVGHTETAKTPIGVAGRVLVYPAQNRINYKVGDAVCAAPGGKVDLMTREEIMMYPERILGIVSEIPDYEVWNQRYKVEEEKEYTETNIQVNGRIWIYVR